MKSLATKSQFKAVVGKPLGRVFKRHLLAYLVLFLGLGAVLLFLWSSSTAAQGGAAHIRMVRTLELDRVGLQDPAGLAFSRNAQAFQVMESHGMSAPASAGFEINMISAREEPVGWAHIPAAVDDPINMSFDDYYNRLLIFQANSNGLVQVKAGADGGLNGDGLARFDARRFGLQDPQGMAIDPASGEVFILDSATASILTITPSADGSFEGARVSRVGLEQAGVAGLSGGLRGLAFDPSNGDLQVYNSAEQVLYEVSDTGQVVATRDLSSFDLNSPQGMVFAPSGDLTDDPAQMNLYIADGSQIAEFSFEPTLVLATGNPATLVHTTDTFSFTIPSPDPAGIAYLEASDTFLFSDSEVDEIPALFTGDNLFEMTAGGSLITTTTTMPFTDEPTGVAYNSDNTHLFISEDNTKEIYELQAGSDGLYGTGDDTRTHFDTAAFGSIDPEGLAFGNGTLFIADGLNAEVYLVTPGGNGVFDGVAPAGDDQVSNFDTASLGINNPHGITFSAASGNLFIVGSPAKALAEVSTSGVLVRMFDTSAATPHRPSGLTFGPGSVVPTDTNIYIADLGVDNNADPTENDGKIYEMSLPPITPGNQAPNVDAGADQAISVSDPAFLNGIVSDDGLPNPPGAATVVWSKVSGPGTVGFADPNAAITSAVFSTSGSYVLRLTAYDGELYGSDDMNVVVTGGNTAPVAGDDGYTTDEDVTLNVPAPGVLDNDSDVDEDSLTAVLVGDVSDGTLTLNSDGSFEYIPDLNFNGTDTFTYVANDGLADSNVATVTITVDPVNDPPVASDDGYTMDEDANLTVPAPGVLDNDSDMDGDSLTAMLVSDASHGTLTLNSDGSFSYTPDPDFNGLDTFTYKSNDGLADSNVATVTITVSPVNDPPVAVDDDYAVNEDATLTVPASGVLANDSDVDGDPLAAVLVGDVSHGTLTLNSDGSFSYTPDLNFNGTDTFTYKANDGTVDSTNSATVTIVVNTPPVAADDAYTTDGGVALVVSAPGVLGNDSDGDGDSLTAALVVSPSKGTLTLNSDGSFTYTPDASFSAGTDTFTYKAYDGKAYSNVATVTVTVKTNVYLPIILTGP